MPTTSERLTNQQLADIFRRIADLLEIKGEVIYKILAYRKAADSLDDLGRDASGVWREDRLTEIPGVGKAKAQKMVFEAQQKKKRLSELRRAIRRVQPGEGTAAPLLGSESELAQEIIEEALIGLGFQKKEIDRAAAQIEKSGEHPQEKTSENVQEWVRLFLKFL